MFCNLPLQMRMEYFREENKKEASISEELLQTAKPQMRNTKRRRRRESGIYSRQQMGHNERK